MFRGSPAGCGAVRPIVSVVSEEHKETQVIQQHVLSEAVKCGGCRHGYSSQDGLVTIEALGPAFWARIVAQ